MRKLCIIPARGGSKRIPRKNIKPFFEKPIIAYAIELAVESALFDEVMVSTDDIEIAEISKKYGAAIPFLRSSQNANDFATTLSVIQEVVDQYQKSGITFHYVCCIYPCTPLIKKSRLKEGFQLMTTGKFDTVFPTIAFGHPIQRALKVEDNHVTYFQESFANSRTQDLEPSYYDAGQFYWLNIQMLKSMSTMITGNSGAIKVSELEAQDIDNETDWKLAELKYKLLHDLS
ncbi:pseudaminic acid cytidylyltransferase [Niabella sp. CC-SYL272]|uniref:pseudaminic acid cytidylyltransferase n=1 Tax=Niabella agricola TaxID=2891571 RepID=UPI001F1AC9E4|nr:pseudaminic acid cytidylyltransferase [Niabella agricola]MCF3107523.1 pseudaminic acid cytidylyltransferase [Niabella agricola]